ncbi:DUF3418 domain-containing protein [Schaalia sp. 19OD2882]|uniref:DUF3418 domain-containing protein n=1 Tax=Schaalia sp. 19OD2882 TaxID=2794089 RepID=UPI0034656FD1
MISFPDLPVSARRDEIAAAIRDHQVVIVAGETGSGKTTQLPKICLQLGRGVAGMIGHTQPRRLAARAVADRIAEELGQKVGRDVGQVVGYQVRFTDEVGPSTLVKLMTDGILLAEIQSDPLLRRYDTLIIDEAHERSLNIDFILGYLARLLPMRPDLKVVITSATIDSERFAAHFGTWEGPRGRGRLVEPAPVIEVSGRTYPVEIRYRPLAEDAPTSYSTSSSTRSGTAGGMATGAIGDSRPAERTPARSGPDSTNGPEHLVLEDPDGDLPTLGYGLGEEIDVETAICHAVDELCSEGDGDILVFLPGERDIRDVEQALLDHLGDRGVRAGEKPRGTGAGAVEILPLFARLSAAEQQRVFEPHALRRVVLATNVAETSLTVPGVRHVVDPGLARISRYSNRTKVQRLPIEKVSQASANQRAGRCGRVADGITIRLYSQADHESRPEWTEPEILRTSLASVILQMAALGLGAVADFPFLDPPDPRAVRAGMQLLVEIGALALDPPSPPRTGSGTHRLTAIGRDLARLPIDPRLGRMLLEADANGCASEVLVIVAALSIQDVRERPLDHQQAADTAHARFTDPHSDFITYLNLWRYLGTQQRDLSNSAFRRMCRGEFLHHLRYREWRDVVAQLRQMARPLDLRTDSIGLPSPTEVAEEALRGGIAEAAARACVAYTRSANAVDADDIHRSLLVGLLSNVGNRDLAKRDYQGARGTRFTIWPGSGLAKSHPEWVMTAELVETSRLFARTVARIRPEWVEPLAGALVKKVHSEPFWSASKGAAMVKEKVLLYGMTLVAERPVLLGSLGDVPIGGDGGSHAAIPLPGTVAGLARGLVGSKGRPAPTEVDRAEILAALALAEPSFDVQISGADHLTQAAPADSGSQPAASETVAEPGSDLDSALSNPNPHTIRADSDDATSISTGPPSPSTRIVCETGGEVPQSTSTWRAPTARQIAREMFILHALVRGQWRERHPFQARNEEALERAREVERRTRTHGLVADEQARAGFFDDLLPADVVSPGHFNRWWKQARRDNPDLLCWTEAILLPRGTGQDSAGFPDHWHFEDMELPLAYRFQPGSGRDGVSMTIPVEVLARVREDGTDWLVPGMLEELVTESVRALPKAKRRLLAPAPEVGSRVAEWIRGREAAGWAPPTGNENGTGGGPDSAGGRGATGTTGAACDAVTAGGAASDEDDPMSLSAAMGRLAAWGSRTGVASRGQSASKKPASDTAVPKTPATGDHVASGGRSPRPTFAKAFTEAVRILRGVDLSAQDLEHMRQNLPEHLRMTFVVVDRSGRELAAGTDLIHLQKSLAQKADHAIRSAVRTAVEEAMADAARRASSGRKDRGAQDRRGKANGCATSSLATELADTPDTPASAPWLEHAADLHLDGLTAFPNSPLPRSVETQGDAMVLRGFPALVPQGSAAAPRAGVRVMANPAEAERMHRLGLAHLLAARVQLATKRVTTRWSGREALMLAATSYGDTAALVAEAQVASALDLVDELTADGGPGSVRDAAAFEVLARRARDLHEDRVHQIMGHVVRAMEAQGEVQGELRAHPQDSLAEVTADVRRVNEDLVGPGFLSRTPASALPHLARYLRAGAVRVRRASGGAGVLARDLADMDRIHDLERALADARAAADARPHDLRRAAQLEQVRWMLQELRVSSFAQQLGTPQKVSAKRILGLLERGA